MTREELNKLSKEIKVLANAFIQDANAVKLINRNVDLLVKEISEDTRPSKEVHDFMMENDT